MSTEQPPRTELTVLLAQGRDLAVRWRAARAEAARRRPPTVWPLWLLSAPLVPAAMMALSTGQLDGFIGDAGAYALIATAAVLTRRPAPVSAEPRFTRRFRLSRKNLAGGALAIGTALAAIGGVGYGLAVGAAFGGIALLAYHLVYGLEPLLVGGRMSAADRASRAVIEALAEAERRLLGIEQAAAAIGNPELGPRLTRIADHGRAILEQIADRPSDLFRARRFLTVFLEGAEQVSDGYARNHRRAESAMLEQNFRNVLVTIEDQFARQRERLQEADLLDLDVQIEVLKKQLEQEGIR